MKYEILRHTVCGDREIEGLDYFDSKTKAEKFAAELTEIYKEDDGHPWSGCKFFVNPVSKEVIDARQRSWATTMACQEMGYEY